MCGLFGLIGQGVNANDLKALRSLGYVSELRGRHGTGFIQGKMYETTLDIETDKTGEDFAYHLDWNEDIKYRGKTGRHFLNTIQDNLFLCHVRHATFGVISPENAHPFEYKNVVGMHNGTLRTKEFLPNPNDATKDWTDSACLYSTISKEGLSLVLPRLTQDDAFALVMVDKTDNRIKIIRNKERTLFWAVDRTRGCLWYASEACFLRFIADRHNLNLTDPVAFDVDTLYSFRPSQVITNNEPKWNKEKVFIKAGFVATFRSNAGYQRRNDGSYVVSNAEQIANAWGTPWDDDDWDYYQSNSYTGSTAIPETGKPQISFKDLFDEDEPAADPTTAHPEGTRTEKPRISIVEGVQLCTSPRKLAKVHCVYCDKEMDLHDQYLGSEMDEGLGAHYQCGE